MPHDLTRAAIDALLRQDLGFFIQRVFMTIRPGVQYHHSWHIDAIAWHLKQVAEGNIKRLIINMPPRNLKSICASVAFPAWLLGRRPNCQFVCASYAQSLSTDLHNMFRTIVTAPWYARAFPGMRQNGQKNTGQEFRTDKGGGRLATSVEGSVTGRGADFIVLDDPLQPMEAFSDAMRIKVNQWYDSGLYTRLNEKSQGAIILVMQRLHADDLTAHLLRQGGWTVLELPAIAEEDASIPIGDGRCHRRKAGDILHPEREDASVLAEIKRTIGPYQFDAQYQQRPVLIDGDMIRLSWFRRYDSAPQCSDDCTVVQSWDTASKTGEINDYSVCTTWMIKEDKWYLLDLFRAKLEFSALKRAAAELASKYAPHSLLIEDRGSGTQLIQELRQTGEGFAIPINPEGDKQMRAYNVTGQMAGGRVYLPRAAHWLADFESEIAAFPGGVHDDQVDSMTQFMGWAFESEANAPRIRTL